MKKIPTIFKRDMNNEGKIYNEYFVDPESFITAYPTEKLDGTNVRVTVRNHIPVRLEKRRNPTRIEKEKGIIDPWYIDASESSEDKHIQNALKGTDFSNVPDGEWSGEALGENIQGNELNLVGNTIFFFSLDRRPILLEDVPTTFDELKEWLPKQKSKFGNDCGIEGVVWHMPNGNMMKIKTKDFK
jgi:hypothetical protein